MPGEFKRYTITAALPYVNGPIHIGHLAGVYVPADIYVRYLRSKDRDVAFVSGSDEHGVAITMKARKDGVTPREIVDKYHAIIKKSFQDFGISFDIYHRTSCTTHHKTAADFFKKLYDDGKFKEIESDQYFDAKHNEFLADRYIIGTCPNCGYQEAYGDQCESCGSSLSPSELIDPRSTLSGEKPELKKTKHWYLPLNDYEPWLNEWIVKGHKMDWKTNVYGQCKSWIDSGLKPRAVTRDLDWGVPVPISGVEGKVLYVWFDAPIGYISATIDWAKEAGKNWEDYWKSEDTKLLHFIGKDNIVFHCIIFPVILKAHGGYILPDNVPANEFLNLEGDKISTSKNWAVWLHEYLDEFPGKEDVLRYVLCANAPETKDNDFTWKDFQARNNNELVAILGNFINRVLVLTHKYFEGKVPNKGEYLDIDNYLAKDIKTLKTKIETSFEKYKFREALTSYMDIARAGNKYLTDSEPWHLIKTNPNRVATIINLSLQVVANLYVLGGPFLPFTMKKLGHMLNLDGLKWDSSVSFGLLKTGNSINEPTLLFEKIEDDVIQVQIDRLIGIKELNIAQNQNTKLMPQKEEITYEDFSKLDIRIGTIVEAEKVEKSKKLLKLKIDTGLDQRTVVSGIAEYFKVEEIIGRQVSILINLQPRKIMGTESQGMILMAENSDGSLEFIQPSGNVDLGSSVS